MLIFLAYTTFPSLKTKQPWQKTLSRLSRCHTLRITGTNPSYFLLLYNQQKYSKQTCFAQNPHICI